MTISTITREESVQAVFDLKVGYRLGFADIEILKRVARMALAAMDSEPHTDDELSNLLWYSQEATCHSDPNYYCEFQRLATPGLVAGIILELQVRRKAAEGYKNLNEMEQRAEQAECLIMCLDDLGVPDTEGSESLSLWGRVKIFAEENSKDRAELQERRKADSEPVIIVGDDGGDALSYRRLIQSFDPGTKLYRHAQLAPASPVCTCPSGDGSLRWPCPVHAGNSPVIPDSARDALEKALAAMEFMGDTLNNLDAVCTEDVELVAPAFDAVRSVLAAAPQEVK
ncbi:hypothetical protein VSO76_24060 [Klebsiella pneumoniae]|uniref:hypothetical protein n=1 Tax=Klebsiella pneumoniae TaxID=573 RepID=UPI00272FA5E6|nr:hypothetical protein [Klebsiella pneumoniae]MDP0895900.1 hypothetical protein [Klebsiella pneumoniae]MEC4059303.1 hypothetical protein [Klebsiella pneumoniae]